MVQTFIVSLNFKIISNGSVANLVIVLQLYFLLFTGSYYVKLSTYVKYGYAGNVLFVQLDVYT